LGEGNALPANAFIFHAGKFMIRKISIAVLALLLTAGCATIFEGETQNITLQTPGTDQAVCLLTRPGSHTRVWAPTTVRITKSRGPMVVDCLAQGNREKILIVTPGTPPSFNRNAANLMLGAAYDYETDAMYIYPDRIVMDFTNVPPSPMPLPEYQKMLAEYPELKGMDVTRPGFAALPHDRMETIQMLQKRGPEDIQDYTSLEGNADSTAVVAGAPGPADTNNNTTSASVSSAATPAAPANGRGAVKR
jgi:hypothetical protein